MFGKHSCGDCKLACVECSTQICPKCMVICPVGNRCRACADKTSSHAVKITPATLVKTGGGALIIGAVYGFIAGAVPMFGFYSWIAVYVIGCLVGNGLHRLSGFKLGPKISTVVVGCLVAGALVPMFFLEKTGDIVVDAAAQVELQQAMQRAQRQHKAIANVSSITGAKEKQPQDKIKDAASETAAVDQQPAAAADEESPAIDPVAAAAVLAKARAAQRQAMLIPSLLSLALFCVGVVTPFAGWVPVLFDRFRR